MKKSQLSATLVRQHSFGEVRSFMGLVQYYGRFIPDLATLSELVQRLTRKDVPFTWGTEQQ